MIFMDSRRKEKFEKTRDKLYKDSLEVIDKKEEENKNPKYNKVLWNKARGILLDEIYKIKKPPQRNKKPETWVAGSIYMAGKEIDIDITQVEACKMLGIGPNTISQLFNKMGDSRNYFKE